MADSRRPSIKRIRLRYYIVPLVVLWTLILITLMAWETASELFPFATQALTFAVIWILGALGIIIGGANLRWRMYLQEQSRKLLAASETRFERLFVEAPIAYHSMDKNGCILDVNTAWQDLLGRKKEEVVGSSFSDFVAPKSAKAFEQVFPCMKEQGQVRNVQFEMLGSDGTTVAVSLDGNIARDASGNFVRTHCTLVNITEIWKSQEAVRLKNEELDALNEELKSTNEELTVAHDEVVASQEALEQLAARNKAILAAVPDIIMEVAENKVYTWANKAGLAFYGDDVLGRKADFFFEGEQETYGKVPPLFEGRDDTFYIESWQRRHDGEKRLLAWWCKAIKDNAGRVTGALSTARDITEQEKAERALRENQELFNATLESTADGILVVDTGGQTVLSNQRFQDMWHIPLELIESRDNEKQLAFVLDQLADSDIFLAKVRELYRSTQESFDTLYFKDGRVFERYSCPLISESDVAGRVWSFRDITKRMQAEKALKFSEEKFAKSFQHGPFFMVISSIEDGTLIEVNDKFVEATGYSREEAIGKTSIELGLLTPEDREVMKQQLFTEGRISDLEVVIGAGIPRTFHARLNCEVITVAGQPRLFVIVEDITERKLTENELHRLNNELATANDELIAVNKKLEAQYEELSATHGQLVAAQRGLAESEARYRTLTENLPCIVYRVQLRESGSMQFFNDMLKELTGYLPEELQQEGKYAIDAGIIPEDRPAVVAAVDRSIQENTPLAVEYRYQHKDGEVRWFAEDGRPIYGPDNQPLYIDGLIFDITERKQAEEALRESEEELENANRMLRLVLDTIPVRVFWKDQQSRYLGCNRLFAQDAGLSEPEDLLGKDDYGLGWHDQAEMYRADDHEVITTGESKLSYEEPQTTPTGETIWLTTSKIPLRNSTGEILGVLGTYEDITERKQLEAQLRQSQKLEAIGTLAGGIAHDFNNILQAILGYTAITIEDLPPGSTMRENLGEVIKASGRARDLVAQILAYARRTEEERQVVDFGLIAKEALKLLRATMLKSIEIHQDIHVGSTVLADPTQLHQVIMNLCTNAMHAMENAGELSVKLAPVELTYHDAAQLGKISPGRYLELVVADSGPGIAPEVVERIFDPFFTTKEPGTGTGMGLAVVHGIVTSCDGAVIAENKPEGGAVFRVYLPITKIEPSMQAGQLEALPTGSESIMLIDDEAPVLYILEKIVKRLGYRVRSFSSSLAALAAFQAEPDAFDLVITDQVMPAKTGLELARQFVSIRPDLPVLLCTGHVGTILPRRVWERWIRMCVTKPFDQLEISHAIRQVLDGMPEKPSLTEQA